MLRLFKLDLYNQHKGKIGVYKYSCLSPGYAKQPNTYQNCTEKACSTCGHDSNMGNVGPLEYKLVLHVRA